MERKVRTPCGLFRESTHLVRKSGVTAEALQAGGDGPTQLGLLSEIQQVWS